MFGIRGKKAFKTRLETAFKQVLFLNGFQKLSQETVGCHKKMECSGAKG